MLDRGGQMNGAQRSDPAEYQRHFIIEAERMNRDQFSLDTALRRTR
jgi:hypothetical protein